MRKLALLTLLFLAAPAAAQVDVGHPPTDSPYSDLQYKQQATLFGGYYFAGKDPAGVAPRSAPMAGLRYEISVGGPVALVARFANVMSERLAVDPTQSAANRELGVRSWPLYIVDFGLALNLTGMRSYRGVVPVITTGIGLVSDAGRKVDEDPYRLGTTFAFSLGTGLRFIPGGRFQMRADAGTWFYQIKYPTAYYATAPDNSTVVGSTQARSFWKRNVGLTLGASYSLFR